MCNECRNNPCLRRCPNYRARPSRHYCSVCDEGIEDGEEYISNDDGDEAHLECLKGMKHLLGWLGYEVKIMEHE